MNRSILWGVRILVLTFTLIIMGCVVPNENRSETFSVVFLDYNNSVLKTEIVNAGESATTPNDPVREGYVFTGWSHEHENITDNMIIRALYSVKTYTVIFKNHLDDVIAEVIVSHGGNVLPPEIPIKEGYQFSNWSLPLTNITEDKVIYAQYTIKSYTVIYKDFDNTILHQEDVNHGDGATPPINPERVGHDFDGWSVEATHVISDLVIYAIYTAYDVTIYFESNEGSPINSITQPYGTLLIAPSEPIKIGHQFLGWFIDIELTVLFEFSIMGASNVTLYAAWETTDIIYIRQEGDQLYLGNEIFRFVSFNVPNLHVLEDPNWHLADPWEQEDAIKSIKRMGGQVIRIYTFSIVGGVRPLESNNELAHIMGINQYHEELFRSLDKALELANQHGVYLIIPFIDEWAWFGGVAEFSALYGKTKAQFFTDSTVKAGFKDFISYVLNRENTYTGVKYKDDPAILAWQLGNELRSASNDWIEEMAAHVKSIDSNHLLMSGRDHVSTHDLQNPNIDIISAHYYRNNGVGTYASRAATDRQLTLGVKPFIIGEYGLVSFDEIETMIIESVNNGTSGSLIWSLRFRNVDGGMYFHNDGGSTDLATRSYHYPGYPIHDYFNERAIIELITNYAYQVQGKTQGDMIVPDAPYLFNVNNAALTWRGGTGSYAFTIERSVDGEIWDVIATEVFDTFEQGPFYIDEEGSNGETYYYRIKAYNAGGVSEYSNVVSYVYDFEVPITYENLALNQTITASSEELDGSIYRYATYANDGNMTTRWSSIYQDNQWIEIEFDTTVSIQRIILSWESAYAKSYLISSSVDGFTYQDVYHQTASSGNVEEIVIETISSNYLRITLIERASQWGFSLYEIEVYEE